jgi:hypothetical protein
MTVLTSVLYYLWHGARGWWESATTTFLYGVATVIGVIKTDTNLFFEGLFLLIMFLATIVIIYLIYQKVFSLYDQVIARIARENTSWLTHVVAGFALLSIWKFIIPIITVLALLLYRLMDATLTLYRQR